MDLAARLLGDRATSFEFRRIVQAHGLPDIYSLESLGDKVVISGNNAGAMAVGLNYYLKNYAGTMVSWFKDDPLYIPDKFPPVRSKVTVSARVRHRFFLNYCTFGYTMPWWSWEDWEHLIDWMALNGVNLPLAITGQESVWYNVWRGFGLNDEEIRNYFTGPAHLPWHRMCNIDAWQGPLPAEWLDAQAELQRRIVARERELSMRPVLPGFGGHIPAAVKRLYPGIRTHDVGRWGHFDAKYGCTYLYPTDPLYKEIQKRFIAEQTKFYGSDHIYGIDCFNEVEPPSWEADSLHETGRLVYESLAEADPEAVWLQMGWLFYNDSRWTPRRVRAYLDGVPHGRMTLLDYYCDFTEVWPSTESFYGHDYIWCYLGNFGGATFMVGNPIEVSRRIENCLGHGGDNMSGLGLTLEGMGVNQFMHEFVLGKAWSIPQDDAEILATVGRCRAGDSAEAASAWKLLIDSVYVSRANGCQGTLNCDRPCLSGQGGDFVVSGYDYDNADLVRAWGLLLEADGGGRDSYLFDVVNMGRQALGNHFSDLRDEFASAYHTGNLDSLRLVGCRMRELLNDITSLLACHRRFSLRPWIESARAMSDDPALKDYYEKNARTLITVWGDNGLNDYANRCLAELNDSYYGERWRRFIDGVTAAVADGRPWDQEAFNHAIRNFEVSWIEPALQRIDYLPQGDAMATARRLYDKYSGVLIGKD